MDVSKDILNSNPYKSSNFFSKITFIWTFHYISKILKGEFSTANFYKVTNDEDANNLANEMAVYWKNEVVSANLCKKKPNLKKVLVKMFFKKTIFSGVIFVLMFVGRIMQPLFLAQMLHSLELNAQNQYQVLGFLSIFSLVFNLALQNGFYHTNRLGIKLQVALSSLLYDKILKLNEKSIKTMSVGQIVNILSNDINKIGIFAITCHNIWLCPILMVILIYLMYLEMEICALPGITLIVFVVIPLQVLISKLMSKSRFKSMFWSDQRIETMNQTVDGMKMIKMYTWERPLKDLVDSLRQSEIKHTTKTNWLYGRYVEITLLSVKIPLFLNVLTCVLLNQDLSAARVFAVANYLILVKIFGTALFSIVLCTLEDCFVAINRIETLLNLEEIEDNDREDNYHLLLAGSIIFSDLFASWVGKDYCLENINVSIPRGKLTVIIGAVGSGKSSILNAIMGELKVLGGNVITSGKISYASQNPWIFNSTIRQNVIFGKEFDEPKYQSVLTACALDEDLNLLPDGDLTIVGDRGVTLSGGQKARLNLARCVYQEADIYLLDDPISSVDANVGNFLINVCCQKFLKEKTCVLAINDLQYVEKADYIILIEKGKVVLQGDYLTVKIQITKYLTPENTIIGQEKPCELFDGEDSIIYGQPYLNAKIIQDEDKSEEEIVKKTKKIYPFSKYLKLGKISLVLIILIILEQVFYSSTEYWICLWINSTGYNQNVNNTNKTEEVLVKIRVGLDISSLRMDENMFLYVYLGLVLFFAFVIFAWTSALVRFFTNASKKLHDDMYHRVMEAPMSFFFTHASGSILNRFSKDLQAIDVYLPNFLTECVQVMMIIIGALIVICMVCVYFMIPVIFIVTACVIVFLKFPPVFKTLKSFESSAKSPVFSYISSSLNGLSTIRTSNVQHLMKEDFNNCQNYHSSTSDLLAACKAAILMYLEIFVTCFNVAVIGLSIFLHERGELNSNWACLAIIQSIVISGHLQHGTNYGAEALIHMTSVERILEYSKMDTEGPFTTSKSPATFQKASIEFKNVFLYYGITNAPVLNNINFYIREGEKVGIIGRTGAGKTSLITVLFRLSKAHGIVLISGKNVNRFGLTDLRKNISVVPQEALIFSNTLRFNLDPYNEHEDNELWTVLEEVELRHTLSSLDMTIGVETNLSLGQKQLICLARAILQKNKILVLDEATANLDLRTDRLIQSIIRKKFQNRTVITIAHRLSTIMDSDKILVMDSGRLIEFGTPDELMNDPNSHFSQYLLHLGSNYRKSKKIQKLIQGPI